MVYYADPVSSKSLTRSLSECLSFTTFQNLPSQYQPSPNNTQRATSTPYTELKHRLVYIHATQKNRCGSGNNGLRCLWFAVQKQDLKRYVTLLKYRNYDPEPIWNLDDLKRSRFLAQH